MNINDSPCILKWVLIPCFLFPVDYWDKHMVCIPIGHWISDDDLGHIVKTIKEGYF